MAFGWRFRNLEFTMITLTVRVLLDILLNSKDQHALMATVVPKAVNRISRGVLRVHPYQWLTCIFLIPTDRPAAYDKQEWCATDWSCLYTFCPKHRFQIHWQHIRQRFLVKSWSKWRERGVSWKEIRSHNFVIGSMEEGHLDYRNSIQTGVTDQKERIYINRGEEDELVRSLIHTACCCFCCSYFSAKPFAYYPECNNKFV